MFVMKEIINKRILNDNIYRLLRSGRIDQIIRHFKIIKNKKYNTNSKNILSQKINNNSNIFIGDYDYATNNYLNDLLYFNDLYESTNEINDIINSSENIAYENFEIEINKEFSDNELLQLRNVLLNYLSSL